MKTIRATERLNGQAFRGLRFDPKKLKGHVKVNLRDVYTGKTKTIEGDNVVTNALADILASDYLGCLNYGAMMPLYSKWFGGLLCYEDAFATTVIDGVTVPDPADYYPQGDDVNKLIAHAGDVAPATAEIVNEDLKRGSPVYVSTTENSVKFIWDFTTRQGNGIISALALTHKDTGNAGIGVSSSAFQAFNPWEDLTSSELPESSYNVLSYQNLYGQYDDNHGFWFAPGEDGDYQDGGYTRGQWNKLTFYTRRLPYNKTGLFETLQVREMNARMFTVTFPSSWEMDDETHQDAGYLFAQPNYYFDYANKYLWIFSNALKSITGETSYTKTKCKWAKIDCNAGVPDADRILSLGVIDNSNLRLAPLPFALNGSYSTIDCPMNHNVFCDGTNAYLPRCGYDIDWTETHYTSKVNGYYKIKLSDSSIVNLTEFTGGTFSVMGDGIQTGGLMILTGGGVREADVQTKVVNNGVGYPCSGNCGAVAWSNYGFRTFNRAHTPVIVTQAIGMRGAGTMSRLVLASKLVHTTKFNLPEAVEKTATQAMTVEYTITET